MSKIGTLFYSLFIGAITGSVLVVPANAIYDPNEADVQPLARCVLCHLRGVPAHDLRIVWCGGLGQEIIIYDTMEAALRFKLSGHCLHFACLAMWLETKLHCPVCQKNFSLNEKEKLKAHFDTPGNAEISLSE